MKKVLFYSFLIFASVSLISCSGGGSSDNKDGKDTTKNSKDSKDADKGKSSGKYGVKSAVITMKMSTMGMDQDVTMYIDDNGNKEATDIFMDLGMGDAVPKIHNRTVVKEGYSYTLDMEKKTGSKMKVPAGAAANGNIDFSKLSDDVMKQMGMKKNGTKTVLGKKCDQYSIDSKSMNMKGDYAVWNNIPLFMEVEVSGMKVKMEATKIDLDAKIDAALFDIPKDFTITGMGDMKMPKS